MTNDELERLRKRAIRYAQRCGHEQNADDFAQEVLIVNWKYGNVNLDWVFADFMRSKFGRIKADGTNPKGDSIRNTFSLDFETEAGDNFHDIISDTNADDLNSLDYEADDTPGIYAFLLDSSHLDLYEKAYIDETPLIEIAQDEGVSPSAISQRLNKIKNKIIEYELFQRKLGKDLFMGIEWITF